MSLVWIFLVIYSFNVKHFHFFAILTLFTILGQLVFLFRMSFIFIIFSILNGCVIRLTMILFLKDVNFMLGLEHCQKINGAMLMIMLHFLHDIEHI